MPLHLSSTDRLAISPSVFSVFRHSHKNGSFHSSLSVHLDAVGVKHIRWMFKEERDDSCTRLEEADGFVPFLDIEQAALGYFIDYQGPAAD